MQRSISLWAVTCVVLAIATTGCLERKTGVVGPNVGFGQEVSIGGGGVTTVDVLFVIDNSGSMSEEQRRLASQVQRLVRDLASPPDRDNDGQPDWNPVEELRIGVATTDVGIGTGMRSYSGCSELGDDGQLRGGVFEFTATDDPDLFAEGVAEVVDDLDLVNGCGWEQPLEAAARAVRNGGVDSHGRAFPSDEGLLAVIFVTDEEDCSVEDDGLFFDAAESGAYDVHCPRRVSSLTPIPQLVEQIRGSRATSDLLFAAIAGLPVDLDTNLTPAQILELPEMQYMEREETDRRGTNMRLVPACLTENPAGGDPLTRADPARRLVELAELVPDTALHTICAEDFGPAIAEIAERIGAKVPGVCLVREVPGGFGSSVPCDITVILPEGEACDAWPAHTLLGTNDRGLQVCRLAQAPGGMGEGFYYDPEAEGCAQLVITDAAQPPIGSEIEAECFFTVELANGELCARSSQCESGFCDGVTDLCADNPGMTPPLGP